MKSSGFKMGSKHSFQVIARRARRLDNKRVGLSRHAVRRYEKSIKGTAFAKHIGQIFKH